MSVKEIVAKEGTLWLANKFSLSASKEMSKEQKGEYAYWCYGVKGKWTNIREENPNVNVKICVILLHSDDRRLCEVLAFSYAQKLENKEAIMRREADTKESRLAQKRQEKAEKKLQRKRDELQKEKEKR